jgi:hypothetical protein
VNDEQILTAIIKTDQIPLYGDGYIEVEFDLADRVITTTEWDGRGGLTERKYFRVVEVEKQWTEVNP